MRYIGIFANAQLIIVIGIIHDLTDSQMQIEELCGEIANAGAEQLAVSYLFLRPAIKKSLESNISDKKLLEKIIGNYKAGSKIKIGTGDSAGVALPADIRNQLYERIRKTVHCFGISVHICGCKNNDIVSESCHITKPQKNSSQTHLF